MPDETWETLSSVGCPSEDRCVLYYPKRICIKMAKVNVAKMFCVLAKNIITKEDIHKLIAGDAQPELRDEVLIPFYGEMQLSHSKKRIRFVFSKHKTKECSVSFYTVCIKKSEWDNFSLSVYAYAKLSIENLPVLKSKVGSEYVVFVDESDKPTRSPVFEIRELDSNIIITGNIKGISQEEFSSAFPSASVKKKKIDK